MAITLVSLKGIANIAQGGLITATEAISFSATNQSMFGPIFPTTSFTKSFGDSFTVPTSAPFGLGGMTLGVAAVLGHSKCHFQPKKISQALPYNLNSLN